MRYQLAPYDGSDILDCMARIRQLWGDHVGNRNALRLLARRLRKLRAGAGGLEKSHGY
jgi:hypothetical protein